MVKANEDRTRKEIGGEQALQEEGKQHALYVWASKDKSNLANQLET